nr:MAG TPA: hypothetical protein [Caudoviricetes sp.]
MYNNKSVIRKDYSLGEGGNRGIFKETLKTQTKDI